MTSVDNDVAISQALIEKHRYCNTEFVDWWEYVEQTFKEDMKELGLVVEGIEFNVNHGQGDYALYKGWVGDWRKLLDTLGYECEALVLLADKGWKYNWDDSARYGRSHFESYIPAPASSEDMIFAYQYAPQKWVYESQELRLRSWLAVLNRYDYNKIANEIEELVRSQFKDLYKMLIDEYEYLTSDEVVIETIIANQWHLQGE